jgi:3,4-dihydroxy 2-butanone 4-phosphate synthase/GTP cyclohydrolase II
MVLVVDDEDRENDGDLIVAAEKVTPEHIAFMVRHTSGLICLPMTGERLDQLQLPLMVMENTDSHRTAFTVSIDLADGTTTGISAGDRARTIRSAVDPSATAEQFHRPGHVFPLRYQPGGVLVRPGHTEAAVDLARLAGLAPAGVLCEVVNDDGSMSRGKALMAFAAEHKIPIITIEDLVAYRWREEALVTRVADAALPTESGDFRAFGYRAIDTGSEHIALVLGDVAGREDVLTRLHSVARIDGTHLGRGRGDHRLQPDT